MAWIEGKPGIIIIINYLGFNHASLVFEEQVFESVGNVFGHVLFSLKSFQKIEPFVCVLADQVTELSCSSR